MAEKILAKVDGRTISERDLEAMMRRIGPQQAQQFNSEQGKKRLLEELVNQKLLLAEAVEQRLEEDDEFQEQMARIKEDVLVQYAVSKLMRTATVAPDEAKAYFEANQKEFNKPETIRARHILLEDEKKANEVKAVISAGMAFEEAANAYSKCEEKNGGDLGFFSRGKMVPEFEEAAFALAEGEMTGPVKTQFGYHLIKVDERKPGTPVSFSEVQSDIEKRLAENKQRKLYQDRITALRKEYAVAIME